MCDMTTSQQVKDGQEDNGAAACKDAAQLSQGDPDAGSPAVSTYDVVKDCGGMGSAVPCSEPQTTVVKSALTSDSSSDISRDCAVCRSCGVQQSKKAEAIPSAEDNSTGPKESIPESDGNGLKTELKYQSLPIEERLPNFTLGRNLGYYDHPIPPGIELDNLKLEDAKWRYEKIATGVRITPLVPGEYNIPLEYANRRKRCILHLTVNPDPWSLWQIKEPGDDALVFEDDKTRRDLDHHQNTISYMTNGLQIIGASRRGRSHEHAGTFRDDDMGFWMDEKTGRYVFIVSDGAGSCKYSREGSRLVIKFIREKLDANLSSADWETDGQSLNPAGKIGMKLAGLASYANGRLKKYVEEENARHPEDQWTLKDFSATILIAALKRDNDGGLRLVTFSIGDGVIAWRVGDRAQVMCRPDSGEFGGGTRFLTTPEVWTKIFPKERNVKWSWETFCNSRVRCKCFTPDEASNFSLFLMTDGVSDPWFETDAGLEDEKKWVSFVDVILAGDGYNRASISLKDDAEINAKRLLDWLDFKIPGNHDDRTILAAYAVGESTVGKESKGLGEDVKYA